MTRGKVSPSSCICQPTSTPQIALHYQQPTSNPSVSLVSPYKGEANIKPSMWHKRGFSSIPKPYSEWKGSSWAYGHMVGKELKKLGNDLGCRADEYDRCGQVVAVRRCEHCGETRPGSGTFREVKRTCNGRSCPYCSWVRAQKRVELLRYAAKTLDEVPGYEWQLLTVNPQYDPDRRSDDMSVKGIRSRALANIKVGKELWKKQLRCPGAVMLRCIEISDRGHVHIHAIYYGPPVEKRLASEVAAKLYRRQVLVSVKRIKGGAKGVARAARYAAKSVKGSAAAFDEDFLAGEKSGKLLHPQLAARWELASKNLRLSEAYGAIRGLSVPRPSEEGGPHDDGDVKCSCGAEGHYRTVYRNVQSYLIECHLKGLAGIEGNRWLPYWMRENVRRKKIRERQKRKSISLN